MQSHFVKLEPPYQIIHYGGVVGIQIGTLIVVGETYPNDIGTDIYSHSHPVVSYVDKQQLRAKLGNERGNRDIASYYGGGEGNVWTKVEVSDVDVIGMSDLSSNGELSPFEWSDFVLLASDGVSIDEAEKGIVRFKGIFDLENYLHRVGLYIKLPPVSDHIELDVSLLYNEDKYGVVRKCIVCQEDNPELITFYVPIFNNDKEIIDAVLQKTWEYLTLMKSIAASVVFRESKLPEFPEIPKDQEDINCLSRVVKTLNAIYEDKSRSIVRLHQILSEANRDNINLPGEPHELLRPQNIDYDPRSQYRRLDLAARMELIRSSLSVMYSKNLFTTKSHWIGTYLVVRDRLEKASFTQTDFANMAKEITPEEFPEKLHISESTMKNFTKVITDPHDRNEAYYDMKNNPQKEFCIELWNVIEERL